MQEELTNFRLKKAIPQQQELPALPVPLTKFLAKLTKKLQGKTTSYRVPCITWSGGHGGPDPGAVGKYGNHTLCEDEYAYDVTLRLARRLIEHGALVYMITRDNNDGIRDASFLKCDKDERCYPNLVIPRGQTSRLRQRKDAVNKLYVKNKGKHQRLIITHVDSRSKRQNIDVFFYYDRRSKTGKKMALNLQNTFKAKYNQHQPNRAITERFQPATFMC